MIILLKKQSDGTIQYLLSGKEYSIGRRNCDIVISGDQSISRKHAVIKVEDNLATLTDCNSKYKTFHDNKRVTPNEEVHLKNNNIIKFGVYDSVYKVELIFITTATSGLTTIQKNKLKTNLVNLKAKFVDNWSLECTHLTVQEIVLTIKVLHAIIDEKPIVTSAYWNQYYSNVKNKLPPPDVADFVPSIAEALLNDFTLTPNPKRKHLFDGKMVIFPTNKMKIQMQDVITKTGGIAHSWEDKPLIDSEVFKSIEKYIFIQCDKSETVLKSLKTIYDKLETIGQRTIPLQEIAMAVVQCSCEVHCNPLFKRVETVFNRTRNSARTSVSATPLVKETESQNFLIPSNPPTKEDIIILETAHNSLFDSLTCKEGTKRSAIIDSEDIADNQAKKIKIEIPLVSDFVIEETQDTSDVKIEDEDSSLSKNMFTKKRKSQDILGLSSKKPCIALNPFANLRNKQSNILSKPSINPTNPFANLRKNALTSELKQSVPSTSSTTNIDLSTAKKVDDMNCSKVGFNNSLKTSMKANSQLSKSTITSNTKKDENISSANITIDNSENRINASSKNENISVVSKSIINDSSINAVKIDSKNVSTLNRTNRTGWLSRRNCNVSRETSINKENDEQIKVYIEKFKNTMNVVKMSFKNLNISNKNNNNNNITTNNNNTTTNNRNFKKFKKVLPLHPQINIIHTSVRHEPNVTSSDNGILSFQTPSSANQPTRAQFVF